MRYLKYIFLIGIIFFGFSCVKDKPDDPIKPQVTLSNGHKTYITNEGKFGGNNASVSLYDLGNGQIIDDIYKIQNNNAVLGDVCQSMIKANNNFYLVVNNSGKIVVVGADDFKLKATITGFTSPRFILPVTFQKAYVSDLYSNSISIIDLNTNTKTGTIACSGWTEQMTLIYNKAFITNQKTNYTYVVNTVNDQIIDSINVGIYSGSIVIDKNSKIWVLSSGDKSNSILGKLSRINPVNLQTEATFTFATNDVASNLCINAGKDTLYFLNSNVYRMEISSAILPTNAFISNTGNNFYGLGVNDRDYTIYVSDAIDYIQKSTIMVYKPNGQQETTFKAGINASGFYFE